MEGFDYAWGFKSSLPATLKANGAKFVVRYVGTSSKCLTASEAKALQAAGLTIGLVYETTGTTFRGGRAAGLKDGAAAKAAAAKLGVPAETPIFFAIDTDTRDHATVAAYYGGCVDATGTYKARLYAGFYVIDAMGNGGHWQTYAWSNGKVSKKADLYQYKNGVTVGGVSMDHVRTLNSNLSNRGGWLRFPAAVVTPPPAPVPVLTPPPADIDAWVKTATKAQIEALIAALQGVANTK